MSSSNRFAWERAVKASDLPSMTRLILLTLATEMDNTTRKAAVTNEQLGKAAGVTARTVYNHLKTASDAGWLTRLQRGHHIEGNRSAPSIYVGLFPEPTGTTVPVGLEANWNDHSGSVPSQPESDDTQPESEREPTGTTVPASHSAHSSHCSEPAFDDIDIEVHRQIKAKKDRGEVIRNERALRASIRRDVIASRELDRLAAEQDQGQPAVDYEQVAAALGRNMAGVILTEPELMDAWEALGWEFQCRPGSWRAALWAWQEANEQRRQTA